MSDSYSFRTAVPGDFDAIIAVVDDWWGRPIAGALPRLFLDHFFATAPTNAASIAFHERLGFSARGLIAGDNRPGTAHVVFERRIGDDN